MSTDHYSEQEQLYEITQQTARNRCQSEICDAMKTRKDVLVEALPSLGKSYGVVLAAAKTGIPITILTGRGHKEQYRQFKKWSEEHELDFYRIPSFTHDCPTANETHGEPWKDDVLAEYQRGISPRAIHEQSHQLFNTSIPCENNCPYRERWNFNPDNFDVLAGHYVHAFHEDLLNDRCGIIDEFPGGAYETTIDGNLRDIIDPFLEVADGFLFDNYQDLIENRHQDECREKAKSWFNDNGVKLSSDTLLNNDSLHEVAPYAAYTLINSDRLENGWERSELPRDDQPDKPDEIMSGHIGTFNRESGVIHLLRPPNLLNARNVIALDGTPTFAMWLTVTDIDIEQRQILSDDERRTYLQNCLNHSYIRTTEHTLAYNKRDSVQVDRDATLLQLITEKEGKKPGLITTATAKRKYRDEGVLTLDDEEKVTGGLASGLLNYGNVLGSNKFENKQVGVVIGSNHYGDEFVKKWGAYIGQSIERDGHGPDLSYGDLGDRILYHMREYDTLQAILRFGRDAEVDGATIYVHTNTLPEWIPLSAEGEITSLSDGFCQVRDAIVDVNEWKRTKEIAAHAAVDIGDRMVRNHLSKFHKWGFIERSTEGRAAVWRDKNAVELPRYGTLTVDGREFRK